MSAALSAALAHHAALVEEELERVLAGDDADYGRIFGAERYSALGGGKRIRPFLVLEFCRLFGGDERAALPFAAAVELMHCFSLIHDDLPCMDNDDLRRGKPTNHRVWGEATALLAGDALAIRALGTAAVNPNVPPETARAAVAALAEAAGENGMIGGQVLDLWGEENALTEEQHLRLCALKTGALIRVSALLGCMAAGLSSDDARTCAALAYADKIGLAFQIVDDILDSVGSEALLGKPIGSDEAQGKTTFLHFYSVEGAQKKACVLTGEACAALAAYPGSEILIELAEYLLNRQA